MRRWLPIVLLLALAGIVALVLRWHSSRAEPLAPWAGATQPHTSSPAAAESALQSDTPTQRAAIAPPEDSPPAPGPERAGLEVRVIGKSSGTPLQGVTVSLYEDVSDGSGASIHSLVGAGAGPGPRTRADGTVLFDAPVAHGLSLFVPGEPRKWSMASVDIPAMSAGETRKFVLVLEDGFDGRVVGRVVCAETREPVAGACVRIQCGGERRGEARSPGPGSVTTGNDGLFELPFPLWSDPRLCVEAEGYGLRYASLDALHADRAHALVINVSRAASLSVRVLDAAGAPIRDARIELSLRGNLLARHVADEQGYSSSGFSYSFPPDELWSVATGADGRAKIEGLAPRVEIAAAVVKDGRQIRHEAAGLKFEPGENREVEWRIGSGTTVRGLALDQDGDPVASLEIWAVLAGPGGNRYLTGYEPNRLGARGIADAEGRFTLEDLGPGRWKVGPAADNGSSVAPIAELIEIAGEPRIELTLRVSRGLFIRGRVLAPNGEGAPNVWVNGFVPPRDGPEDVNTESDGSFTFGPVGPGRFTLAATAVGRFASSDPVQASGGDSGIVLRLKQDGTIRGRVVDGVTGAACAAQLVFGPEEPGSGTSADCMQTTTQPDGSFTLAGFRVGRWSVTASTADGRFAQHAHIDVGAGTDSGELVLALSPGGKLRFGYKGAQPCVYVTVMRQGAAVLMQTGVEQGKIGEYMAPAGALVLEIRKSWSGPARTQAVELKPGETQEITLTDED